MLFAAAPLLKAAQESRGKQPPTLLSLPPPTTSFSSHSSSPSLRVSNLPDRHGLHASLPLPLK